MTDITLTEPISSSPLLLNAILDNCRVGMMIFDTSQADLPLLYLNRAALPMLPATEDKEKAGIANWATFLHGISTEASRREIDLYRAGREDGKGVLQLDCGLETFCWVEYEIKQVHDDSGSKLVLSLMDISSRIEAEEQIHEKTNAFYGLLEALPDMYFRVNRQYVIVDYQSNQQAELYEHPDNFLNRPIREVLPQHVAERIEQGIDRAFDGSRLVCVEYQLPVNGYRQFFEARLVPHSNYELIAIIRNITQYREVEERFRIMADCAPTMIWMSDETGQTTFFNKTWLDFTGRTMAQEIGDGWTMGIHPDDFEACINAYHNLFQKREPFEMVYRLRRFDGEYRWILDKGTPRCSNIDDFQGFIGSCVDITERVQFENDLKQITKLLSSMLENIPITMFLKRSDDFRYVMYNRFGEDLMEAGKHQLIGKTDYEIFPEDLADIFRAEDIETVRSGQLLSIPEQWMVTLTGKTRTIATRKIPITDDQNRVVFVMGIVEDITRHKQDEKALEEARQNLEAKVATRTAELFRLNQTLKASEARFRRIFDSNVIGIIFTRSDGVIWDANDCFLKMVGYTREELHSGLSWVSLTPEEYLPQDMAKLAEAKESRVFLPFEKQYFRKDGSRIDILAGGAYLDILDSDDTIVAVILDITERKGMEEALRATNDILYDYNLETNQIHWNIDDRKMLDYCNSQVDSAFGWWEGNLAPQDRDRVTASLQKALQENQHYWTEEYCFRKASGEYAFILDRGYIVYSETGNPTRMIGAMTDITKLKHTEVQLQDSLQREQLVRRIVEVISRTFNIQFILRFTAREISRYYQCDRCLVLRYDQIRGNHYIKLFGQYTLSDDIASIPEDELPVQSFSYISGRHAGSARNILTINEVDIENYIARLRAEADPADTGASEAIDVFERYINRFNVKSVLRLEIYYRGMPYGAIILQQCKHHRQWTPAEAQLLEDLGPHIGSAFYQSDLYQYELHAKEEAETANRRKDKFLTSMSHEFRTPLHAIIGFSEMLEKQVASPMNDRQAKYAQNISTSGYHLLRMVNDLLDIAKIEAERVELAYEWISLAPFLENIECMLGEIAAQKDVYLVHSIEPGLDGFEADPARFRQILYNLISNAIKFNRNQGQVIIDFKRRNQDWVVCEIRDTGRGIPRDKLQLIFQEFYQVPVDPLKEQHEGTGLGLALTKKLIELHGGCITVDSMVDQGTVFRFMMPAKRTEKACVEADCPL